MSLPFSQNAESEITKCLTPDTISYFENQLTSLTSEQKNKLLNYSLVITGTVGAGKSTRCETLAYLLNKFDIKTNNYPEYLYIDPKISGIMLGKKIKDEITAATFQSYILDNWEKIFKMNGKQSGFNLFERCADDCILCFCNIANENACMSDLQFLALYERLKTINTTYNIPSYFNPNIHFTEIAATDLNINLRQILDIIIHDIDNSVTNRIIGLKVSNYESKFRIELRAREGEDGYSMDSVQLFNNHYTKLFDYLSQGKYIKRFVDVGKFM